MVRVNFMAKSLSPRSEPVQSRARKQREKILKTTANLLKTVGLEDLTTILIAEKVGISVGTLYHYFPNKYSILYALSATWVEKIHGVIDELGSADLSEIQLKPLVNSFVGRFSEIYKNNSSLLPLVTIMGSTPELEAINDDYLEYIYCHFSQILMKLPISLEQDDAQYLAIFCWQICHSTLHAVYCSNLDEDKSVADLKFLLMSLLEKARLNF